jgi:hypothetical protein
MPFFHKLLIAPKALRQFGARPLLLYAWYQFKLRSGFLKLQTPAGKNSGKQSFEIETLVIPAKKEKFNELLGLRVSEIFKQADEILAGGVRLFGGELRKLELTTQGKLQHWTAYHSQMPNGTDIKPIWEMGRFGWATVLARAYWLSEDERYAEGFWRSVEKFIAANPPNLGPHWSSAQEVALRLISWAFCYSLFIKAKASTVERKHLLAQSIVAHAERIPPTLDYALAQNNNHLLSEALGLCTSAALLPSHPKAEQWRNLGSKHFLYGIDAQIHEDGSYAQHSSNYHRLILQLGTWARMLLRELPLSALAKLARATDWQLTILDQDTGRVPNLGPNDGAYILPLSILPFEDYRAVVQAASLAFRREAAMPIGVWDEMNLWMGVNPTSFLRGPDSGPLRMKGRESWAYFRVAQFKERPGHADQLQVDLWWRGLNIAQDPGSYLYTAPSSWDNALSSARAHNAVIVNGREPMTKAGRFLWLDWTQADLVDEERGQDGNLVRVLAEHHGYRRLGVDYRRQVVTEPNRWVITDRLTPKGNQKKEIDARLHWLLPDWDWQIENEVLRLRSPHGFLELDIDVSVGDEYQVQLIRAGELVHGEGTADPILGWVSLTYGVKEPALSLVVSAKGLLPITITSTFTLPI